MERQNQVTGIAYRNICAEYGLEVPKSKWEMHPKVARAKILWHLQIQTDKKVMANLHDTVVVYELQKIVTVMIDVAIPSDRNIKRKKHEKLQKYQGLKEEVEKMWELKAAVVPVVIRALGAVTP